MVLRSCRHPAGSPGAPIPCVSLFPCRNGRLHCLGPLPQLPSKLALRYTAHPCTKSGLTFPAAPKSRPSLRSSHVASAPLLVRTLQAAVMIVTALGTKLREPSCCPHCGKLSCDQTRASAQDQLVVSPCDRTTLVPVCVVPIGFSQPPPHPRPAHTAPTS